MCTSKPEPQKPDEIAIKDLFPKEADDFTQWLAERKNLLQLGEILGLQLEPIGTEVYCGGFKLDILAKDTNSKCLVAIENQLEGSDTGHLGQLITYAAMQKVGILVWIATSFWETHRVTLEWLNEHTSETIRIYAVEVHGKRVSQGSYFVDFRLVVSPSVSRRSAKFRRFFQPLITDLWWNGFTDKGHALYRSVQLFPTGFSEISYAIEFSGSKVWVYLWIATDDKEFNKRILDRLYSTRTQIEKDVGTKLFWICQPKERTQASFGISRDGTIDESASELREIRKWMRDSLLDFKAAVQPHLELAYSRSSQGDTTE